jgi:hypothetical protein
MYDDIRHWLPIMPAMALLISYALWHTGAVVKRSFGAFRPLLLYGSVIASAYLLLLYQNIKIHPYQVVYFNSLVGGARGAQPFFELDNWGHSFVEAARWLNAQAAQTGLRKIYYHAPLGGYLMPLAPKRFQNVRRLEYPYYEVYLLKGHTFALNKFRDIFENGRTPSFSVYADGAPLLHILTNEKNIPIPDATELGPSMGFPEHPMKQGLKRAIYRDLEFQGFPNSERITGIPTLDRKSNWYIHGKPIGMKFSAYLKIPADDYYCLMLLSDDGALLRLNGSTIISKPCCGQATKEAKLRKGLYDFYLEYRNTGGPASLDLSWSRGSCSDAQAIRPEFFVHRGIED